MALIVCKNCGKKVSDTIDICIHCQQDPRTKTTETIEETPLKQLSSIDVPAKHDQIINETQTKTIDFNKLNEKKQIKLEAEFWKEDKWANKYIRSNSELFSYIKPIFIYPFLFIIIVRLLESCTTIFIEYTIINETAYIVALISGILLITLCIGMLLYAILKSIYNIITHAKYKYYKRLQKWLKEKKNIDFYPNFITIRQKEIFEAITIE